MKDRQEMFLPRQNPKAHLEGHRKPQQVGPTLRQRHKAKPENAQHKDVHNLVQEDQIHHHGQGPDQEDQIGHHGKDPHQEPQIGHHGQEPVQEHHADHHGQVEEEDPAEEEDINGTSTKKENNRLYWS